MRHNGLGKASVAMARLVVYTFISSSARGTATGSYPLVLPVPLLFFFHLRFYFLPVFSSAGIVVSSVEVANIPSKPPTTDASLWGFGGPPFNAERGGVGRLSWVTLVAFGSLVLPAP